MHQTRGILYIPDPLGISGLPIEEKNTNEITLVFHENERYLYQAQAALWRLRKHCGWVCVCGAGASAAAAAALAAQLPVDRLALAGARLFSPSEGKLSREFSYLRSFARRNLSLVASEVIIADTAEAEVRRLIRGLGRREICLLEKLERAALLSPWMRLQEKNLLNPWKCV